MGWLADIFQGIEKVPLAGVLKERVALAEQKYDAVFKENTELKQRIGALEKENADLRDQLPKKEGGVLRDDTIRVLAFLFRNHGRQCDLGMLGRELFMEQGVLQYHLDRLREVGYADWFGGNYATGQQFWGATAEGRRHVVDYNLSDVR